MIKPATMARLRGLVDTLGAINAEISELEKQATSIKAELAAAGLETIEGDIYRAAIVISERVSINAAAVRRLLGDDTPTSSAFVQSVRVYDKGAK